MTTDIQFYSAAAYIGIFLLLGFVFKRNPPTKINYFYGYRTRRVMANQQIWDAANSYWSRIFYYWQWVTLLLPIVTYFIIPSYIFITTVLGHTLFVVSTVPATEKYLDKHYDKNGNPK